MATAVHPGGRRAPAGDRAPPSPWALLASVSRLHIVAIAACGTFTFGWLFTGLYPWLLAGVCALDWFLVNLLNRVVDLKEDQANAITGTDFVARHRRAVLVVGFGLLASSLVVVHLVASPITPLRIAYHLLGFAYNWPILPGRRRIKQLYFWKNTASATGFMLTVFGYPLALAGWGLDGSSWPPGITLGTILFSAGFFFLFELSYEVIYDLRDAPGDALAAVRSYAVVHGQRGAVRIIDGLVAGSLAFLVVGYLVEALPWRIFIMFAAPLVQLVVYKRALRRGITARDCIGLTWLGAALLVTYHLWVVAGLPGVGLPV
ncbi:MAG: UbiA family prenyltransferase [Deltaproteobacteria bacterium]|nr:UbiA family prenyltransferase [Deltaproteobacteria bacterium]